MSKDSYPLNSAGILVLQELWKASGYSMYELGKLPPPPSKPTIDKIKKWIDGSAPPDQSIMLSSLLSFTNHLCEKIDTNGKALSPTCQEFRERLKDDSAAAKFFGPTPFPVVSKKMAWEKDCDRVTTMLDDLDYSAQHNTVKTELAASQSLAIAFGLSTEENWMGEWLLRKLRRKVLRDFEIQEKKVIEWSSCKDKSWTKSEIYKNLVEDAGLSEYTNSIRKRVVISIDEAMDRLERVSEGKTFFINVGRLASIEEYQAFIWFYNQLSTKQSTKGPRVIFFFAHWCNYRHILEPEGVKPLPQINVNANDVSLCLSSIEPSIQLAHVKSFPSWKQKDRNVRHRQLMESIYRSLVDLNIYWEDIESHLTKRG